MTCRNRIVCNFTLPRARTFRYSFCNFPIAFLQRSIIRPISRRSRLVLLSEMGHAAFIKRYQCMYAKGSTAVMHAAVWGIPRITPIRPLSTKSKYCRGKDINQK